MTYDLRLTPLVAALPATVPFVGPETLERERGAPFAARLGANENGFGPSPRAMAAMAGATADIWKYGDSLSHELRHALAQFHGCTPDNILVGEGIDGLLGVLVRLLIAPGDAVVTSDGAYPTFNYHVAGFGGVLHKVPYRDDREDPEALLDRARLTGAKLIYLANPDNPMGSWLTGAEIDAMIAALPAGTLLCLDEAYLEMAPPEAVPTTALDDPRVIRMRTFSKSYGLAGARIGYALGATSVIASFDRVRNHFGVNAIAQAGALAALQDRTWAAYMKLLIEGARGRIAQIAHDNGLRPLPSATNFVAIDCGRDGVYARAVLSQLAARDVFVRMPGVAPLDRCIRVSCGPDAELDVLAQQLPAALKAADQTVSKP
ncbi:histidinol-phosphate aminotransferase [Thioclava sp. SK-1]|uniref:pyridoxal phosphate-dependent aminotransferase n=1 Tax=Thioclava sp. SK-1 TaxID=1889770 RepID=UPI0008263363|nr:pyridoxal phosphate-dependent aminotransferase [Thioclava sp. SK-1]OCX64577.1 histidinol-phosphate aminotransferase [Thioclava sp. SK-1]